MRDGGTFLALLNICENRRDVRDKIEKKDCLVVCKPNRRQQDSNLRPQRGTDF